MATDTAGNLKHAVESGSEYASKTAEKASGKVAEWREGLKDFGASAKEATQEQIDRLQKEGARRASQVAEEVKGHPFSSLLIAAGIGLVLGALMRGVRSGS